MPNGDHLVHSLSANDRLLALLVAEGLSDSEIAQKLGESFGVVDSRVRALLRRCGVSRLALSLIVLTKVLNPNELLGWTAHAETNRQRLHDAGVVDFSTARLAQRLATSEYWLVSDAVVGRHEEMSAEMVAYNLAPWMRVLGSRIAIQVTIRLAPIRPHLWAETDRNRK